MTQFHRHISIGASALTIASVLAANPQTPTAPAAIAPPTSPPPAKTLVVAACTACHSTMVIENAHKSVNQWEKTLKKMESQGLPKLPERFRKQILDYLTENHGPRPDASRENRGPWGDHRNANPLW